MTTAPTRTIFSVLSEILSVLSLFFWNYFKKSDFSYPNHGKYWRITTWLHMLLSVHSASVLLFITAIFISSSEHLESRKACLKNNIFGQVATFITLLIFLARQQFIGLFTYFAGCEFEKIVVYVSLLKSKRQLKHLNVQFSTREGTKDIFLLPVTWKCKSSRRWKSTCPEIQI